MTRKLTRIQTLLAGGAFALAGIGGSAAALAADTTPAAAGEQGLDTRELAGHGVSSGMKSWGTASTRRHTR